MVIDLLTNAHQYYALGPGISAALHFLQTTDLAALGTGTHVIDGANIFAIVQEYDTMDAANEQMEAHRKHIDVQYVVSGAELVGHALHSKQTVAKEYDATSDFMLYADAPDFYTKMQEGTFMIFYPTDLHMPCLKIAESIPVKKVVVKVKIQAAD